MLPSRGYCRTDLNAWLYLGTRDSEYSWECISLCNSDEQCVAFTYDSHKGICEFQCLSYSELCEFPEFPPGNQKTCVTMTDDRDTWSECYTKLEDCDEQNRRVVDRRRMQEEGSILPTFGSNVIR